MRGEIVWEQNFRNPESRRRKEEPVTEIEAWL